MILPSFLEYSVQSLEKKLELILANSDKFQQLVSSENENSTQSQTSNLQKSSQKEQKTQKKLEISQIFFTDSFTDFKSQQHLQNSPIWHFHLDFVLPQFAKDRSVMQSLGLKTVFGILKEKLFEQNLALTVHLMGEMEDWAECFDFLKNFLVPQNWQIELFVPTKITNWFSFGQTNLTTFTWFDLGFWQKKILKLQSKKILQKILNRNHQKIQNLSQKTSQKNRGKSQKSVGTKSKNKIRKIRSKSIMKIRFGQNVFKIWKKRKLQVFYLKIKKMNQLLPK